MTTETASSTEPVRPGARRLLNRAGVLRTAALSLVATVLVLFVTQFGLPARLETAIADQVAFREKRAPSGKTILIVIDDAVIKKTGKFPIDRALLAEAIERLAVSGVRRVHIDSALNAQEGPDTDAALERAFSRLGRERASLTTLRINSADGNDLVLLPLERFARHASVTSPALLFDADRRLRRVAAASAGQEPPTSDWLTGGATITRDQPLAVDFSIDVKGIPRFTIMEAAEGRIPNAVLQDAYVVLGTTVIAPQSVINVPIYGRLSRIEIIALATETMLTGRRLASSGALERAGITFAITLAFALALRRLGLMAGLLALVAVSALWLSELAWLQHRLAIVLPAIAPPLACLVVWQALKLRESKLAHTAQGLYTRLVGVGQNALVMAIDVIAEPAVVFDRTGRLIGANPAFRAVLRETFADVRDPLKLPLERIFGEESATVHAGMAGSMPDRINLTLIGDGGIARHFEVSLRAIDTATGRLAIASFKDVTEARAREAELTALAFRDALTGISNRIAFHARLHALGQPNGDPFAILLIDLDGFKKVNDTLGHHAGDVLLAGVARRLVGVAHANDMAARLGGDEFAVLVPGATAMAASALAARIIAALRPPFDIEGTPASVGASIGIAVWPEHHADPHEALKLADAAMYAAKRSKPAYAVHSGAGPALVACA